MSVDVGTQTDPYETGTIGLTELILLEQLQSKWFRTFPTFSPLTRLRIDMGLTNEEEERASYSREFEPAFGKWDKQLKVAEKNFQDVENSWKKRGPETAKVVEVIEETDQCSCKIFC